MSTVAVLEKADLEGAREEILVKTVELLAAEEKERVCTKRWECQENPLRAVLYLEGRPP